MSAQSGAAEGDGAIRRDFYEAMEQMSNAWDTVRTTQIKIFELNLLLQSLSTASSSDTALQAICQDLKPQKDDACAAYKLHSEATAKITDLQAILEDATRSSSPFCQVPRSHNCRFLCPVPDNNRSNMYHRFRNMYHRDPATFFGQRISNHRIAAFRDIQGATKSILGNGHTPLSVVVDADGNCSDHRAEIVEEVGIGEDLDSWALMEARFFYSIHIEKQGIW